ELRPHDLDALAFPLSCRRASALLCPYCAARRGKHECEKDLCLRHRSCRCCSGFVEALEYTGTHSARRQGFTVPERISQRLHICAAKTARKKTERFGMTVATEVAAKRKTWRGAPASHEAGVRGAYCLR